MRAMRRNYQRRRGMLRACARARARAWFVVQHALVLVKLPALAVLRDAKVASIDQKQRGQPVRRVRNRHDLLLLHGHGRLDSQALGSHTRGTDHERQVVAICHQRAGNCAGSCKRDQLRGGGRHHYARCDPHESRARRDQSLAGHDRPACGRMREANQAESSEHVAADRARCFSGRSPHGCPSVVRGPSHWRRESAGPPFSRLS
eukprot:scaffold69463_cov56-Phaeocystis_antarctica.AAC.3